MNSIISRENGLKLPSNVAVYGDTRPTRDHSSAFGVSRIREKSMKFFVSFGFLCERGCQSLYKSLALV